MNAIETIKTEPKIVKSFVRYLIDNEFPKDGFNYDECFLKYEDFLEPEKKGYKTFGKTALLKKRAKQKEITEYRLFGINIWTSEKTVYADKKRFVITFLNQYKSYEMLLDTIIHEFTHFYLYLKIGKHKHESQEWKEQLKIFKDKYLNYYWLANLKNGEIPQLTNFEKK